MGLFDDVINGEIDHPSMFSDKENIVVESDNNIIDGELITEAYYPEDIPYLKTIKRVTTMPKGTPMGKGNLCFLYSMHTKDTLNLIKGNGNFKKNNNWIYYYYNMNYTGRLYNRQYIRKNRKERDELYKFIPKNTKLRPYLKLSIEADENKNMYFDMKEYLNIFHELCNNLQPKKKVSIYWNYMKSIILNKYGAFSNRFVLADVSQFKFSKDLSLSYQLNNPIYMIYYTLYRMPELLTDVDIDFYFYNNSYVLKINPSKCDDKSYRVLKVQMKKLYSHLIPPEEIDVSTDGMNMRSNEIIANVSTELNNDLVTNPVDDNMIDIGDMEIRERINDKVSKAKALVSSQIVDDNMVEDKGIIEKAVKKTAEKMIDDDPKLLEDIYRKMISEKKPKSIASTARDEQLRKEQEKLKIGDMTVAELKKINATNIQVPVKDVSNSVRTTNKDFHKMKFANHDKTYEEKLMMKDITNAILAFNDKSIPLFVRDIKIEDTSDELNLKDTYRIYFEDGNRQRHTVTIDIPKFVENRFLYIGGNRKVIKHQDLLCPVVKTSPDTVQITTNYNKMFIQRTNTKSLGSIERFKKLINKSEIVSSYCTFGNASTSNKEFVTTLEYDELSKILISFKNSRCNFIFNQIIAAEYAKSKNINIPKNTMFIGTLRNTPVYIDTNTQLSISKSLNVPNGMTIVDIISQSLNDEEKDMLLNMPSPKRLMMAKVKVMQKFVFVGILLGFWEGLTSLLNKSNIKYELHDKKPKQLTARNSFIKFSNCYLVYEDTVLASLLLNPFKILGTETHDIEEYDDKEAYMDYIIKTYGKVQITNALFNTYEFMIDPITKETLETLSMPTDVVSVIIYAVNLLSDSQFVPEINKNLSRTRMAEIIPAILYERMAKNYINFKNSNGRKKFTVPQNDVIKTLMALPTVEDYSSLNPVLELESLNGVSCKGFRGVNLDDAYTPYKRTYDPTMTGVIAPSSPPDAGVGVNKMLTFEPNITSLRGFAEDKHEKLDELNDVNLFSAAELMIPLLATYDDPTRMGHAIKQSRHQIPVKKSSPVLMSNGFEEVCRFRLSSDFAINAEEDGEIVDYDEESKIMIAKYKSGKCRAINLANNIVKNGGGGFFLSNEYETPFKVGDKFKKDDALVYHKDFFTNDGYNNCRMNVGTLTKVALMSTYNTYEDSTMITEKLADEASTEMTFSKIVSIGKNANVEYIVTEGMHINVGDSLIRFDNSFEDDSLNKLLATLSDEGQSDVLAGSRNDIKSKYSGVIERIMIYCTVELDELSPSLKKIVSKQYRKINHKKKFLEKYDESSKNSIIKCGMLITEPSSKIDPDEFGVIKGQKLEEGGVVIFFYIKHSEPLEIGSKVAMFTGLKNTVNEVIPEGYEPWSEFRPDEEIGSIIASNSILNRMVPTVIVSSLGNKLIVELKRKLQEIYNS